MPTWCFATLDAHCVIDIEGPLGDVEREWRRTLAAFLASPKACTSSMRWRGSKNHRDYFAAQLPIMHPAHPHPRARIVMQSHIYFAPRKYSFQLLFGVAKILRLDVDPKRGHRNLLEKKSVSCSHWQYYPGDHAIPDDRPLSHRKWLDEFFEKCNITFTGRYSAPIHDKEQLRLLL